MKSQTGSFGSGDPTSRVPSRRRTKVRHGSPDVGLAAPLQQVDRTCVLEKGRKLIYFAGCDYFRLSSAEPILAAVHEGLDRFGLNVAASRKTTGNHPLYGKIEKALAGFFQAPAAVLVSNGYMTNLCVAQALTGEVTHVLIDKRSHGCLQDAAQALGCPVQTFSHRNAAAARTAALKCGRSARPLLITDGLFSHSGELAPLPEYVRLLPRSTTFLVDDAHAAGTIGKHGRGTLEAYELDRERIIQTITLSKAFGVYGGAILGSQALRERIIQKSRLFVGNTPLPLPLVYAAMVSLEWLKRHPRLPRQLVFNIHYVKAALAEAGWPTNDGPGPIIPIMPKSEAEAMKLSRALRRAGIHPPLINYLGSAGRAYFRFVISSEHTASQLDRLVEVLTRHRP